MATFQGLIPPLCTPLNDDGGVDTDSLARLLEHQLSAGVDGVFVLGSSGEAAYLDDVARLTVVTVARATVAGAVPLLVGALDSTPARVIEQIRRLDATGLDGWVVTAPFYANCNNNEVAQHFRAIAAVSELPLLAYDIPGNVGRRLDVSVSAELLQDGVLAGLKDSSGTLDDLRRLIHEMGTPRSAALLTGVDALADLALTIGADGLIPGLANARPSYFVELIKAHNANDTATVDAYQDAILELTEIFSVGQRHGTGRHASELGALKHILASDRVIAEPIVSAPLTPYPTAAVAELTELVAGIDKRLEERLIAPDTAQHSSNSQTKED